MVGVPGRKAGDFFSVLRREWDFISGRVLRACWMFFKIMIPVSIAVKLLKEVGGLEIIAPYFSPVMAVVGLPGALAIVWVTTMLAGLYGGILALSQVMDLVSLTGAQATVLTCMMLSAHAMIVELRICRLAGVRTLYLIALRVGFGLLLGVVLSQLFSTFQLLQHPVHMVWHLESVAGWKAWAVRELFQYLKIIGVVTALVTLLRILDGVGLTALLKRWLRPLLLPLGIGESMAPMVVVGLTLGLAYGGGLIVEEARNGHVDPREVVMAISLLCICHSLVEDTILMMMVGGDALGVIWIRIPMALVTTWGISHFLKRARLDTVFRFFAVGPKGKVN